jgi:hypothetical protein
MRLPVNSDSTIPSHLGIEYDGGHKEPTGGETLVTQALLPLARAIAGLPAVALAAMLIAD